MTLALLRRVRVIVIGNALGNSIVDASKPKPVDPQFDLGKAYADKEKGFRQGLLSNDPLSSSSDTADLAPGNATAAISGDQTRAVEEAQAAAASDTLEEVVITGRQWNGTDSRNLQYLTTPFLRGGDGMVDDHGEGIARRTMQMTDMGFDPLSQRQNLAIVNDLFTPWGQAKAAGAAVLNAGIDAYAGLKGILGGGVSGIESARSYRFNPYSADTTQALAGMAGGVSAWSEDNLGLGATAALGAGLEFVGDVTAIAPVASGLRSVAAGTSWDRALQMPITIGDDVPYAFGQSGASSFRLQGLFKTSIDEALQLPLEKQLLLDRDVQAAIFRNNMGDAPFEGAVGHHVVPLEARTRLPELMQTAAKGGFDINGAENGAWLEQADHYYGHPEYNALVIDRLSQISRNLSPSATAASVRNVVSDLQIGIKNNTFGPWR